MSLSDRFGLRILFEKPGKDTYLKIVKSLASVKGVDVPEDELEKKAELAALRAGGRSARLAKQFVESFI